MRYKISPTELVTASKSILNQVNWSEVVLDVVGRERPALYRDAFEKILRLHVEELLTQKYREENKLNNHQEEGQRSLSAIKSTEQVSSRSAFTSCDTDEKPPSLKEQGDDDSYVDIASDISEHDDFTNDGEESETDEDDTEYEGNGEDEDGDYEEDRSSVWISSALITLDNSTMRIASSQHIPQLSSQSVPGQSLSIMFWALLA